MTPEIVHTKIARQSPDERQSCLRATGVRPLALDRWLADPNENRLSDEDFDALTGWAKGEYGYVSNSGSYVRMRSVVGAPVALGVRPPLPEQGPRYAIGQGAAGSRITRAALNGGDIPGIDDLKFAAAKRKEAEQEAARKAKDSGFVRQAVQPLVNFGRLTAKT